MERDDDSKKSHPAPGLIEKSPGEFSGAFSVSVSRRHHQVRVRMRIMKLSKLNSATCIHASDSLR
jgi:hypothetical protein